jgi:hypothetical protein
MAGRSCFRGTATVAVASKPGDGKTDAKEKCLMSFDFSKPSLFLATLCLGASFAVPSAFAADQSQDFAGRVTDAMCGAAQHNMVGKGADCIRGCIRRGSRYALVVGDKVYALDTNDKGALAELDKLADHQATVTGQVKGNVIAVASVAEAK